MDIKEFTAGTQRAIELSKRFAASHNLSAATPELLLAALLNEENRASELLLVQEITTETCQSILPEGFLSNLDHNDLDNNEKADLEQIVLSPEVQQVLSAAHDQAAQLGRHVELGTEYLLLGLLKIESPVSELLCSLGMSPDRLVKQIESISGFTSAPLEVDLHLDLTEQPSSELFSTYRILDAAANRAREGLRVVEDFVRFSLDDAFLSRELKELRHHFVATCLKLDQQNLLDSRNTLGDVGTNISTKAEGIRHNSLEVLKANIKRFQEALRTMEEWSKSVSQDIASAVSPHFEQMRYQSYQLEKSDFESGQQS